MKLIVVNPKIKQKNSMQLDRIRENIATDLEATEQLINELVSSDLGVPSQQVPAIAKEIGKHVIKSGGKRLRPVLSLLAAKACGYENEESRIKLAAVIELIHIATLLHDDVVDDSTQRRGRPSANTIWNNSASILVGDYFISRAFDLVASMDNINIVKVLASTTNAMATGEVQQLMQRHNPNITEEDYRHVIYSKTASLFRAATMLGAMSSNASEAEKIALASFGEHLGNAFQMVDDLLDYSDDSKTIGKNIGDDLAEGKTTLPLIYALNSNNISKEEKETIKKAVIHGKVEDFEIVQSAIIKSKAIEYTINAAHKEADLAVEALLDIKDSIYKERLLELAKFAVVRAK